MKMLRKKMSFFIPCHNKLRADIAMSFQQDKNELKKIPDTLIGILWPLSQSGRLFKKNN